MPRNAYDPFKDESLGHPAPKTRFRVDWTRGARLLAMGEASEAVAAALGIPEDRLWRHFHKSLRFQFLFRQALERRRLMAQLAFEEAGRRAVVQRCGRSEDLDGDSLRWLARQTGLTHAAGTEISGAQRDSREFRLAAALKETGRRPPSQAFQARIRKERQAMDAEFAALKAWGREAGILPPAPDADPAAALQAESGTAPQAEPGAAPQAEAAPAPDQQPSGAAAPAVADKPRLSENKTQISGNKIPISESGIRISTASQAGAAKPSPAIARPRPAEPAPPATGPFRPHHYGSVIDLTDMDGNPLPGREHLLKE